MDFDGIVKRTLRHLDGFSSDLQGIYMDSSALYRILVGFQGIKKLAYDLSGCTEFSLVVFCCTN